MKVHPATCFLALCLAGARTPAAEPAATTASPTVNAAATTPTSTAPGIVVPPKPKSQSRPFYPTGMENNRIKGEVKVEFDVTEQGRVENAVVLASTASSFGQAALEAVRRWTFEPATLDGRPVRMKMQQLFRFEAEHATNWYQLSLEQTEGLRTRYHYDVAPMPKQPVQPVYPYALLVKRTSGSAHVRYQVDEQGRVTGNDVLEASHPEFGLALAAAIERTEFSTALDAGQPKGVLVKMARQFKPGGIDNVPSAADLAMLEREQRHPDTIVSQKKLDAPLKVLAQPAPVYPFAIREFTSTEKGTAEVAFIVDEEGFVRLPRIEKASEPAFGYAAVQACVDWRFEPPRANGKPVAVRARVPFSFRRPPPAIPPEPASR